MAQPSALPAHLRALLSVEAGLKAELALVPADVPAFSAPRHIAALREALSVLQREEAATRKRIAQRRKELSDLKNMNVVLSESAGEPDPHLALRVEQLRTDLLVFAQQQWPPPPVVDEEFEGDLWEAVVRACRGEAPFPDGTDPGRVEYTDDEVHLAILLVQTGLAVHPSQNEKALRLAPELFYLGG